MMTGEEYIRAAANTHMDVGEALYEVKRAENLAIVLNRAGGALAAEIFRLRAERDAALNLAEGYAPHEVARLREQIAFDRRERR